MYTPKLVTVLREGYSRGQLLGDLAAGLIVAVVALPLSIAFAIGSGVPPAAGIATAIVAGFLIGGALLLAMGLLRAGAILKFIPFPVVTGFTAGIAVVIFSGQVKDLGLRMGAPPAGQFKETMRTLRAGAADETGLGDGQHRSARAAGRAAQLAGAGDAGAAGRGPLAAESRWDAASCWTRSATRNLVGTLEAALLAAREDVAAAHAA